MDQQLYDAFESLRPKHPLEAQGWVYKDWNMKFSPELWRQILESFGTAEYLVLVSSTGFDKNGDPWQRGQVLLSPQAVENHNSWVRSLKKEADG